MSRRSKIFCGTALIFCFLLLRFFILWTGVERVSHQDELDFGTMAREIIGGLKLSYSDYQLDFYSGESLVLGIAAVPFFKLMGMNLLALKMVPLLFSFLTALAGYFFLRRHFGEKAGWMGGALLVFCPVSFAQLSLVGMSGHSEALLWSIGAVGLFYEFLYGGCHSRMVLCGNPQLEDPRQKHSGMTSLFLSGLLSGFGFWFYYANGIMTVASLLSWFLLDRKSFLSWKPGVFGVGFLAGFAPWFVSNTQDLKLVPGFFASLFDASYEGLRRIPLDFFKKTGRLFFSGFPNAFAFYPAFGISSRVLSWSYAALCFLPAVFWGLKAAVETLFTGRDDKKLLPLGLYLFVFCIIFGLVHFELQPDFGFVGYRYLTPVIYWGLLLFGVMTSRIRNGTALWLTVIALGMVGQTGLMAREPGGRALLYKGYSYYQLGIRWEFSEPPPFKNFQELSLLAEKFQPEERYYFYWGLSNAGMTGGESSIAHGRIRVQDFLGGGSKPPSYFLEWAGNLSRQEFLKAEFRKGYLLFMNSIWFEKKPLEEVWNTMASGHLKNRTDVLRGMGWAIRENFREDRPRAMDWINRFPSSDRSEVLQGMKSFETRYNGPYEI